MKRADLINSTWKFVFSILRSVYLQGMAYFSENVSHVCCEQFICVMYMIYNGHGTITMITSTYRVQISQLWHTSMPCKYVSYSYLISDVCSPCSLLLIYHLHAELSLPVGLFAFFVSARVGIMVCILYVRYASTHLVTAYLQLKKFCLVIIWSWS